MLADELNKVDCAAIVIAGDLFDVAEPSIEEVGLMYDFLKRLKHSGIIIPGNHEMTSKTKDCFRHIDSMLKDFNFQVIRTFGTFANMDIIPYNILHKKEWKPKEFERTNNRFAITHVRGEIPPHVTPEIDLDRFSAYDKVFAGDLHSVTNRQLNIHYPGSPFVTSFHRSVTTGSNGYFIIDSVSGDHSWHELFLPQLVRQKVQSKEEIVKTEFHHTIYELEGDLEELAKVAGSDLLDKKITKDISTPATLNMSGDITEELAEFLTEIKEIDKEQLHHYISLFKDIILDTD
jgi:DNA repair exonuclease SbcCD nuclease subunit